MTEQKLETLDEIMDQWDQDSKIDLAELHIDSANTGKLHSKYMRIMTKHSMRLRSVDKAYANMFKDKKLYYTGKMSREQLKERGWEQFDYNLGMKNELDNFFKADKDLQELEDKKFYHNKAIEFCEAVIKNLASRSYNITNIIAFERLRNGGG